MKKYGLFLLASSMLAFASCDKDEPGFNDNNENVVPQVLKTFQEKYPDAQHVTWELKDAYSVAHFYQALTKAGEEQNMSAWFENQTGNWSMTETDIPMGEVPEAVKKAFAASEYATWMIDDVDLLNRNGVELIYVIEVEKDDHSVDLYYSADGVLVKTLIDSGDDYDYEDFIPQQPQGNIYDFIKQKYPNARIVDIDVEPNGTEVEIVDVDEIVEGFVVRDLLFNASNQWVYTKTEVHYLSLPEHIKQAFANSEYKNYYIDDIDFYQMPNKEYYRFDLESPMGDIKIDIASDGKLTPVTPGTDPNPDGGNNGGMVNPSVQDFIKQKYPNATIIEQDYEDGFLEVEIWDENREKKVYFNGAGKWVYTKADYHYMELPEAVKATIQGKYPGYEIDDIEQMETEKSTFFLIELEGHNDHEITIRVDANGTILN